MNELTLKAIELHKSGKSMVAVGADIGKSASWVCKCFKSVGYVVDQRETHPTAFSEDVMRFLLANHTKSRKWLAEQVGKSAHSVSQWLQKRSLQIMSGASERRLCDIECLHCGTSFKPSQSTQKFCSLACMGAAKRIDFGVATCIPCGEEFSKKTWRQKFCCVECGQEGYQNQHIAVRPYQYNGIKMRSTWEVKFAVWLDSKGFTWKYEPTFFALPNRKRYAPDFYVVEHNAYYEIKGWMKEAAAEKIRQFREIYTEHRLVLINKNVFKTYGIKV